MKTLATIAIMSLALAGCQTAQQDSFIGPSGSQNHTAKCSQSAQQCFQAATQTCRGSYRVLDSYSKAGGLIADIMPGPVTWYYMSYQCGPSDGSYPQFAHRGPGHVIPSVATTTCSRYGNTATCTSF